ncbi:copper homeostasis protein CutC [Mesoplasma florum]|uniref:copper homeostasis protein CutC n=1 Tax=Mesoplasma florum TaxID=2151 RepID=UPI000D08EAFC|nr:copper homeostasis protein CutC [Mesoplasma florum]AVN61303.1 copper homeostasis protein CutC [Mesoplasma florum]
MKLEIIAKDIEDIILLNKSNADRIEFCSNLEIGGLTPSYEDIKKAGEISKIPVNIMLRPTDRDFFYSESEFKTMLEDLKYIKTTNVEGIVVGIITPEGEINIQRMKEIMKNKGNKKVTFHKAFDHVKDFKKSIDILYSLGVDTVLTSCGEKIDLNIKDIKDIKDMKKIIVMAGGGVNESNIKQLSHVSDEIHVGTAVRFENSWNQPIIISKVNEFKKVLEKKENPNS